MSAPEFNAPLEVVPAVPLELSGSRRTLAAIVFTDTANFSVLMARNEERTLDLVARDLGQMKSVCGEYGGQVLKSTGDGLLMLFGSVVQSVACAMEIQRRFLERNRTVPGPERLEHRIGIHLGDVFQERGDVMGDGVNIAARLQAESRSGGICLSNTVYDVVQNRIQLVVTGSGRRKLKNIGTMVVYQIFPINSRYRYLAFLLRWLPKRDRRNLRGLAVGLAISAFVMWLLFAQSRDSNADALERVATNLGPLGPPVVVLEGGAVPTIEISDGDNSDSADTAGPFPAPGKVEASAQDFNTARFNDMKRYDFAAMSLWLGKNDLRGEDEAKMKQVCDVLVGLTDWRRKQLSAYTAQSPLKVQDDLSQKAGVTFEFGGTTKSVEDSSHNQGFEMSVWTDAAGNPVFRQGKSELSLPWDQVPPLTLAQIAVALLREKAAPNAAETPDLWRGLKYFVDAYQVKVSSHWHRLLKELSRKDSHKAASDEDDPSAAS